jgi:beta-galactosidase
MKKQLLVILILGTGIFSFAQNALTFREVTNLSNWKFYKGDYHSAYKADFDDSNWEKITVPHTWNAKDILTKGPENYKGPAWYRTSFNASDNIDKRYFIRFDGASITAEVFVNSQFVGKHKGAYSAFCYDITSFVYPDSNNIIAVKVNNTFDFDVAPAQPILFPLYGGLYRPVKIFTTPASCISPLDFASSGVYISQPEVTKEFADIDVEILVNYKEVTYANGMHDQYNSQDEVTVSAKIFDLDGKLLDEQDKFIYLKPGDQRVKHNFGIKKPFLWDAKRDPYLYSVLIELIDRNNKVIDKVVQPLGIRYFHVDKEKGLILNGEHYDCYGVTRHQEWEGLGSALSDEHHKQDMAIIEETGANALRLAHYQQANIMYSMCDTNGLVIWAEIPVTPHYRFDNSDYLANAKQQLIELIKQNYNHPSILFWGLYNEVKIPADDLRILNSTAKELDQQRLTTQADCYGLEERHYVTDLVAWNKYYAWYEGSFDDYVNWADTMLNHEKLKVGISEYGAGGTISQQKENPETPDPFVGKFYPEQYQRIYHEEVWKRIKDRDDLWCKFVWNTFDFSWELVHRGDRPFINHKGLVTHDREVKKDAFYFYKANWSDEPVLYIASKRNTPRRNKKVDVMVYTNLDKVELFINGKSISKKKMKSDIHKIEWSGISLSQGRNKISVIGSKDVLIYTDKCVWEYSK